MNVYGIATVTDFARKLSIRSLDWQSLIGTLWSDKNFVTPKIIEQGVTVIWLK